MGSTKYCLDIAEATIIVGNLEINETLVILSIISPNKNRDIQILFEAHLTKKLLSFLSKFPNDLSVLPSRHPAGTPVPSQSQQKTPLNYGESAHFKTTGGVFRVSNHRCEDEIQGALK